MDSDQEEALEAEAIAKVLAGERDAFAVLVSRHQNRLYRFILKFGVSTSDAQDLAQECFLRAFKGLSGFQGDSRFSTWLLGIALNLVRSHLRQASKKRGDFVSEETLEQMACHAPSPAEALEWKRRLEKTSHAFAGLSEDMREILILVVFEELSYAECARLQNVPVGTVRSRLSRARAQLGKHNEEISGELMTENAHIKDDETPSGAETPHVGRRVYPHEP